MRNLFQKNLLIFLYLPLILFAFEPEPVTPYPVLGFKEIGFFDDLQKMNRQLLVWYPVDPQVRGVPSSNSWDIFHVAINAPPTKSIGKMPLIVLSHGYLGDPHSLSWLIRDLVYRGFIVIGIQHRDLINGKFHANHWQRAQDVKIMIDQIFSNPITDFINKNQVGIAGYSLGGTTAILVAGGRALKLDSLIPGAEFSALNDFIKANEVLSSLNKEMMSKDWRDPRIKAAFVMAPAWAWLFDEESLKSISIPTYLIATEGDKLLVTKNNAGLFAHYIPHAIYQMIPGKADHYVFLSALNQSQRQSVNSTGQLNFLLLDDVSVDRSWIQFQVAEEAERFFHSVLKE